MNTIAHSSNHIWILFGWEAQQAAPNRDPYTNLFHIEPGTGQIYTSEEHFKHHWRRALHEVARRHSKLAPLYGDKVEAITYYRKEGYDGEFHNVESRRKAFATEWALKDTADLGAKIAKMALDLPLFGFVSAGKKEKATTINSIKPLFMPSTFHESEIISLGVNNAFPSNDAKSAGSSMRQMLRYGHFLSLIEIDLRQLEENTKNHRAGLSVEEWVDLALAALWAAYTTDRKPSVSQRNQFATFMAVWRPDLRVDVPKNPADIFGALDSKLIRTSDEGLAELKKHLPAYLEAIGGANAEMRFCRRGLSLK